MAKLSITNLKSIAFQLAWKIFSFSYGIFTFGVFVFLAFVRRNVSRKLSDQEKKELATARANLWDLDKSPYGLTHRFCTIRNGRKLHYLESLPSSQPNEKSSLIIFVHGFPDSWAIWKHYLQSGKLKQRAVMVAVDLPGYGGSDSLESYQPEDVLGAITEFVLKMREQYISGDESELGLDSRVVLVGHDWGAVVGFRLASEAPQLADRFILSNGPYPALSYSNVQGHLATASQMLRTWVRQPRNTRLLYKAASNFYPLFKQTIKSGYVFVFNLPMPLANFIGGIGNFWLLHYIEAVSKNPAPNLPHRGAHGAEALASSVGPSEDECNPTGFSGLAYPASVRQRAANGGYSEKIRYYRDGLAFNPWDKSLEILWDLNQIERGTGRRKSSSTAGLFDLGPAGSLRASTTVIWGKEDNALETSLTIEGMGDFFSSRPSQLIVLSRVAHWAPLEKQGVPVFEEVIEWAAQGEKVSLNQKLGDDFPVAKFVAQN